MLTMAKYALQQVLWIVESTAQLLSAMGIGMKWVTMTIRCFVYACLDIFYFLPHAIWYVTSPNIIRRVAYRSSHKTRMRNLELLLTRQNALSHLTVTQAQGNLKSRPSFTHTPTPTAESATMDVFTAEALALSLNPADATLASGLPANLVVDSPLRTDSHFLGESALTLQRLYQRQHDRATQQWQPSHSREANEEEEDTFTESDDEDEEDKRNLHNRATLDIYLPVPLDALFHVMDQEKHLNNWRRDGMRMQRKKFPVIISVSGGAWIIGSHFWSSLLARVLAARGYVVFCPDYRNFPQTTMEGMVLDISDALAWVLNNADRYNGNLDDVTLVGQSAGAHLTMMSLLSQAHLCAYNAAERDNEGLPPPSDVAYNVPRYNPRKSIHRYVGLSGIYNVAGLVKHFDKRGLYRSVLCQIAGGKAQLPRYSIPCYFDEHRRASTGETLPDNLFDYLPAKMCFLHGDADKSAPMSESANLVYVMRHAQRDSLIQGYLSDSERTKSAPKPVVLEFILIPGATHTDAIVEEPLCFGGSHLAEYLSFWEEDGEADRVVFQSLSTGNGSTTHARVPSRQLALSSHSTKGAPTGSLSLAGVSDTFDEEPHFPVTPVSRPDGVLLPPSANGKRPAIIRLASRICPF